jgi:membrane protein DedA with SNARE-associated domain
LAVIPATIVLMLASAIGGVAISLPWGSIALAVIAAATLLQSSYMIGGHLSDAPSPRAVPRISLRPDLLRIAQFG